MATLRQQKVAKAVVENGGVSISAEMLKAGYSPATAKTPQKLTESDGWKELMGRHLSLDKTVKRHEKILESEKDEVALKAVELSYKVNGKLRPDEGGSPTTTINILQLNGLDEATLRAIAERGIGATS